MTEPWSFVGALGIELWEEGGFTHGRAELIPEMCAPGTTRVRLGVLATMVDMVAGFLPTGPINPTVDLRVTLLSRPPECGSVFLVCHPAKVGRRLFVGETLLHTGDPLRPFARSTCTFMNERIEGAPQFGPGGDRPRQPVGAPSFDDLLRPRFVDAATVEMDRSAWVANGPGGTIQGGAQALLAELAAEHALAPRGRFAAVDLDIRFLNRVRTETVTATAEVVPDSLAHTTVRVPIVERGDPDGGVPGRMASLVAVECEELA